MKYEISKEQLDKIAFPFLDKELKGIEKYKTKYFHGIVFKKPDEEFGVFGYEKSGTLWIYYKFVNKISSFFSLKTTDAQELIGRWAEDRLQIEVINTTPKRRKPLFQAEDRLQIEVNKT